MSCVLRIQRAGLYHHFSRDTGLEKETKIMGDSMKSRLIIDKASIMNSRGREGDSTDYGIIATIKVRV